MKTKAYWAMKLGERLREIGLNETQMSKIPEDVVARFSAQRALLVIIRTPQLCPHHQTPVFVASIHRALPSLNRHYNLPDEDLPD